MKKNGPYNRRFAMSTLVQIISKQYSISFLGLILDVYGSFWLVKSIIITSSRVSKLKADTFFDENPYAKASEHETRLSSYFGFTFLILGFIGQALAVVYPLKISLMLTITITTVVIVMGVVYHYRSLRSADKLIPKDFRDKHGGYLD
ncbi:MAG: hypothetical protein JWO40_672 [Candidatus Doudnabacteria bacterium]|nr:hypothetical protein [Candidatus Doudnabacteria bacterium]